MLLIENLKFSLVNSGGRNYGGEGAITEYLKMIFGVG